MRRDGTRAICLLSWWRSTVGAAAALIGTLAGCRAFHGRFGDGVRRGVSGRFLRFTGRHFSGFIAFHWGVTSAVSLRFIGASLRRFHCEFRGGYETLPLGCGTERALPSPFTKTFPRAISATFSDRPHHFVTVSGRSSREHCVRDARGGACPCHVGSFPFHGLRSVY